MESTHPEAGCTVFTDKRCDAFFHFACSLVGERESHDATWRVSKIEQMDNFISEHTCFSRAGTGNHKLWTIGVEHGNALLFIKLLKIIFQNRKINKNDTK